MSDDYAELLRRRALTEDAARPDTVERRRAANGRTARENIADLVDAESFVEYGRFAIAAQRFRRDLDDLIARTPADGLVAGTARINSELFGDERSACAVLSYDYTVLATAAHENAKALNAAQIFEIDDVIDPADTRRLIADTLAAATMRERRRPRPRFVDTW